MSQSLSELDPGQVIKEFVPPPSEILAGAKASIGTSAVQITATETLLQVGVTIKALAGNSNTVYIGASDAVTSSTGYPLAAGEEKFIPVDDLSLVWLIGGASGQEIRYLAN